MEESKQYARPRRYSPAELDKVEVEILDRERVHLRCKQCGTTWSPDLRAGGHLPRRYWQCPQGCNRPQA